MGVISDAQATAAVVSVAQKVEAAVKGIVATTTPAKQPAGTHPGALVIKQVRRASGKLSLAKPAPGAASASICQQPHIEVSVAPLGGGAPPSKWEDIAAAAKPSVATRGSMMIDTGAGITLVTRAWAVAHNLKISSPPSTQVKGASGQEVKVVGTTQMTLQLAPTLEIDVANVAVSEGSFYQALLGCELLEGKTGILGPATISMGAGGSIQWSQEKLGCIAVAKFMPKSASVNAAAGKPFAPPPAATGEPAVTFDQVGVKLDAKHKRELSALAKERDQQRAAGHLAISIDAWRGLLDCAQCLFRGLALPANISRLARQAFAVRDTKGRTTETVLARVLAKAQTQGYEAAVQELEGMGIPSQRPQKTSA